jgi:hypothetical protein
MRRLPALLLFMGCAGLLLVLTCGLPPGPPRTVGRPHLLARGQAGEGKGERSAKGRPFRLPADEGGALLGRVLPPRQRHGPLPNPMRAARRTPPADFALPPLPLPRSPDLLPRWRTPARGRRLQPQPLLEEELGEALERPAVPQRPSFAVGKRLREESADTEVPPPLPILARPVPDRASLEDATLEESRKAALAAPLPGRTKPAGYARVSMPEPYEHRRPLTRPAPAERAAPVASGPRGP